jgi:hypothetical protein
MPSSRKATTRIWAWTDRRGIAVVAAAGIVAAGLAVAQVADTPTQPDQVAAFMRAKLGHAQNVLEGLSLEDYDLIARGAHDLSLASQASSWQVLQTEDYVRHSAEFRRACDGLRAAARAKNLDGALVAWMEVTMKCVQCHRYVRDEQPGRER